MIVIIAIAEVGDKSLAEVIVTITVWLLLISPARGRSLTGKTHRCTDPGVGIGVMLGCLFVSVVSASAVTLCMRISVIIFVIKGLLLTIHPAFKEFQVAPCHFKLLLGVLSHCSSGHRCLVRGVVTR